MNRSEKICKVCGNCEHYVKGRCMEGECYFNVKVLSVGCEKFAKNNKDCKNFVEGTGKYAVRYGCGNVTNMYGEKILCNKCKKLNAINAKGVQK